MRHDFVLQKTVVIDVIGMTPEGKPLEPALRAAGVPFEIRLRVVVTNERPKSFPTGSLHRLGIGKYVSARHYESLQIPNAPPEMLGRLELHGDTPAFASLVVGSDILAIEPITAERRRLVFRLSVDSIRSRCGTVRLQLISAISNAPLPGVGVEAAGTEKTDAEGAVVFKNVNPGLLAIRARARDHEPWEHTIRVAPGSRVDLGRIVLHKPIEVPLVVVDPLGEGTRASLKIHRLDGPRVPTTT